MYPPIPSGWRTVSDVPRRAVEAQIQAVTRMLVGGISVGGVYAVSREVGKVAVERLGRLWPAPGGVLVHVSSESSAFTVRAVADAGAGAGAWAGGAKGSSGAGGGREGAAGELAVVDVKYQSVAGKLITYHCMFDVALAFEAPATTSSTTAANNTAGAEESGGDGRSSLAALQAEEDAFFRAFLKATKMEEALLAQAVCFPAVGADSGEEEGEGRFTKIGPNLARVVEVYTAAFVKPSSQKAFPSAGGGAVRPVQVYGSVGCVACIHEKESDHDGVAALKEDCLQSLRDRVHILREEAATELEEEDSGKGGKGGCLDPSALAHAIHAPEGGVVRLPRRVLLPLDPALASSMLLAEYLLPGEEAAEAVARVKGVFGPLPPSGVVGGRDREAAVVFPELEAALVGVGVGHQDDTAMGMEMGMALSSSLGRISSCNSLSMGRAPSTSSLLGLGRLDRVHSSAFMASTPHVGSVVALEGEEERPVTMDAEEEEEEEGEEVPIIDVLGEGPSPLTEKADAKAGAVLSSVASSPQLMICTLVVGLAMVVGAALLHGLKATGPG